MSPILASISEHWQSIGLIILSAVIPGAAGGLVAHFINNERVANRSGTEPPDEQAGTNRIKPLIEPARPHQYRFESAFQSAFIGMCGAVAFIFFVTAIGGIRAFTDPSEIARFIALSMIAGFGARRLLPMMVTHLEKQIAHAEESADRALNTAEALLAQLETAQQRMSATEQNMKSTERKLELTVRKLELVRINANLLSSWHASAPKSTRDRAILDATAALAEIGDSANQDQSLPAIFINLARLYRASGKLDEAIELLERFVMKAERGELVANANVSVAYYNLACYRLLKEKSDTEHTGLERALDDFERSIKLSPNPADDMRYAQKDADLSPMKETKRFKDLLKRFIDDSPGDPAG